MKYISVCFQATYPGNIVLDNNTSNQAGAYPRIRHGGGGLYEGLEAETPEANGGLGPSARRF